MLNPVVPRQIAMKDLEKVGKFYTALFDFARTYSADAGIRPVCRPVWQPGRGLQGPELS